MKPPWPPTGSRLLEVDPTNANTALASAFAEELARSGVSRAVVSPGSRSTPLAVALWRQPGIEVTIAIDERSGSFFALGAAQASGEPVVLLCTSGTAAANFHPAVAEADLSSVPLIVLTADRPPELRDIGAGQTIDQVKLYGSSVRWFSEVGTHDADDQGLIHFRSTACRAYAAATGDPRPGPVHLNISWRDPLSPVPVPESVTAESVLALEGRGDAPLNRVLNGTPWVSSATLEAITRRIDAAERILVVAGRQRSQTLAEPLSRIAARCGAPVIAEPTSQLRYGSHDRSGVVTTYDHIAKEQPAGLAPDLVIRFGEMPTSKPLRIWLSSLEDLEQIVIDPLFTFNEPTRTAGLIVRSEPEHLIHLLEDRIEPPTDRYFLDSWLEAERLASAGIEADLEDEPGLTAGLVHRALADCLQDGDVVYTASSMAIRDQEAFLPGSGIEALFLANRGANGIDGLVASGIGASAATGRPVTIITGDLGFQHDVGSLSLVGRDGPPVRIVVLNNNGGAIFSRLPQKQTLGEEEFEALMSTPGGMDVKAAAGLFGLDHRLVDDLAGLPAALAAGTGIIEIPLLP